MNWLGGWTLEIVGAWLRSRSRSLVHISRHPDDRFNFAEEQQLRALGFCFRPRLVLLGLPFENWLVVMGLPPQKPTVNTACKIQS